MTTPPLLACVFPLRLCLCVSSSSSSSARGRGILRCWILRRGILRRGILRHGILRRGILHRGGILRHGHWGYLLFSTRPDPVLVVLDYRRSLSSEKRNTSSGASRYKGKWGGRDQTDGLSSIYPRSSSYISVWVVALLLE